MSCLYNEKRLKDKQQYTKPNMQPMDYHMNWEVNTPYAEILLNEMKG